MYATPDNGLRARWEVLWIAHGKIQRKKTGYDLAEAMRIRDLVKAAGRSGVTLRCCNMGFPPPEKLQARTITFDAPKLVRGKRVMSVRLNPMRKRNAQGVWWCPYCMQLRRFVKRKGFTVDGIHVPEPGMHCPMCNISHRDWHVQRWNPIAARITARVADPNRRAKRQRARRRQRNTNQED